MATRVSTFGAVNGAPLRLNYSGVGAAALPTSSFMGKKISSKVIAPKAQSGGFKVVAVKEIDESKQTDQDRWKGLVYDISDDQQDITRGKGMVDTLFQAPMGAGTHDAILSSYEYISTGLRTYLDNNMDGFYIAPAFMDKLVVHITKNFMTLPNIKVPLILGIWGGKGQGKSFQCELVFAKMGITPIVMSAGELESGNAGEPAKLIRQRYREAADIIKKGKMCCLFINDLDAGAGRMGGTTQYTVNNQMVNATLMNIADNPTCVQLPGMYNKEENPRVPIIVTGNDFSTLYAPLIRDGRMEKFYWAPTRDDRIGVCTGIFRTDNVPKEDIVKLVDTFPGQSIDFFGALRARVYDDEVRKWITGVGVEKIGKKLVNSKEGPPTFEQPKMTLETLLEYGNMLVQEQENVKRVKLADQYLNEAALGDANKDAMDRGTFYGKEVENIVNPLVPEDEQQVASSLIPEVDQVLTYPALEVENVVCPPVPEVEQVVSPLLPEVESVVSPPVPEVEQVVSPLLPEVDPEVESVVSPPVPEVEQVVSPLLPEVDPEVESVVSPPVSEVENVVSAPVPEVEQVVSPPVPEVENVVSPPVPEVEQVVSPPVPEIDQVVSPPVPEVDQVVNVSVPEVENVISPQVPEAEQAANLPVVEPRSVPKTDDQNEESQSPTSKSDDERKVSGFIFYVIMLLVKLIRGKFVS